MMRLFTNIVIPINRSLSHPRSNKLFKPSVPALPPPALGHFSVSSGLRRGST